MDKILEIIYSNTAMWLIVIASLIVLMIVYYFFHKSKQYKVKDDLFSYKPKEFLLSRTEKTLYDELCRYISSKKLRLKVFPKIRLTDFIWSPKDNRNAYLRISGKFVDFLIVDDRSLKPLAAVFITNQDNKAKMFSLQIIEPALASSGIVLLRVASDAVFKNDELFELFKGIDGLGGKHGI